MVAELTPHETCHTFLGDPPLAQRLIPTMPDLALCARDCFGEDGSLVGVHHQSSFDVVLELHTSQTDDRAPAEIHLEACRTLQGRFGLDYSPDPPFTRIRRYVENVLIYLDAQYQSPQAAADDRLLLSSLFWGNLVEVRHAACCTTPSLSSER